MFYRSTMLIITHVYFFPRRIVYAAQMCMKGNPCTACTHTEMCVLSHSFLFFSIACIFHVRLILFIFLPEFTSHSPGLSVSLSLSVIVVASWNSDTCSTMMREAFPVIHIFIHNKSMQIALIRARARFGSVVLCFWNWMCFIPFVCVCACMFACYMRNGNLHIFYQQNIDNTGSFS